MNTRAHHLRGDRGACGENGVGVRVNTGQRRTLRSKKSCDCHQRFSTMTVERCARLPNILHQHYIDTFDGRIGGRAFQSKKDSCRCVLGTSTASNQSQFHQPTGEDASYCKLLFRALHLASYWRPKSIAVSVSSHSWRIRSPTGIVPRAKCRAVRGRC